jgi:hypothetical protein
MSTNQNTNKRVATADGGGGLNKERKPAAGACWDYFFPPLPITDRAASVVLFHFISSLTWEKN